jgi:hypothetical protein
MTSKYSLLCCVLIFCVTLNFSYITQGVAQIPAEEFGIEKTCSESELDPSFQADYNPAKDEFLTYENNSLGFRIQYPSDWKRIEEHCILEAQGLIQSASIINLMSTPNSKEYGSVGVSVGDFVFEGPIDTFIDIYTKDFGNMIKSKQPITFTGLPAAKFIINTGNNTELLQITTLAYDRKYDITMPIANWIANSTISTMLDSFEIINPSELSTTDQDSLEINELG